MFWLFSAGIVSVLIVGFVAVNALLVQTTYEMQSVSVQVQSLADQQVVLTNEAATLSSPERVAGWARTTGFEMPRPGDTVILRVPGVLGGAPEGGG